MTVRRQLARLSQALVVATLVFSPAAVAAQASAVPSSATVETVNLPNAGGAAYQDGFRKGFRDGFKSGYLDARTDCQASTGVAPRNRSSYGAASQYSKGYAAGFGNGFSRGFSSAENKYCK